VPSSSRARIASAPFRNALLATLAVSAGTSGHGRGCMDMMTRFCSRTGEGKSTGRKKDHEHHHDHHPDAAPHATKLANRVTGG
jgi:hypothetical protein